MANAPAAAIALALCLIASSVDAAGSTAVAVCKPPANLQTMKAIGDVVRAMYPMDADPKSPEAERAADRVMAVDRHNTAQLRPWLQRCGWPSVKVHGQEVENTVWLLVQHADQDRPFQQFAVGLLKVRVLQKDAPGAHLAYLADRVAVGMGRRQMYGTQVEQTGPCKVELLPVDDGALVNQRRKEAGLNSLDAYMDQLRATLLPSTCRSEGGAP